MMFIILIIFLINKSSIKQATNKLCFIYYKRLIIILVDHHRPSRILLLPQLALV